MRATRIACAGMLQPELPPACRISTDMISGRSCGMGMGSPGPLRGGDEHASPSRGGGGAAAARLGGREEEEEESQMVDVAIDALAPPSAAGFRW